MIPWIEEELARDRRRELEAEADAYRRASSLLPADTLWRKRLGTAVIRAGQWIAGSPTPA
ncbi:hypothetical protein [Thermomicrobium sp.]